MMRPWEIAATLEHTANIIDAAGDNETSTTGAYRKAAKLLRQEIIDRQKINRVLANCPRVRDRIKEALDQWENGA